MPCRRLLIIASLWVSLIPSKTQGGDPNYPIGPGDVLVFSFYPDASLNREVRVRKNGTIHLPLIGELRVEGKTPEQVATEVERRLREGYYQSPVVEVWVKEYYARRVGVFGAVKKSGVFPIYPKETLLSLMRRVGGPKEEASGRVAILTPEGQITFFSWNDLFTQAISDPVLVPGSTVYFFPRGEIYVMGEVQKPGAFPYREGITLLQALGMAGGFTPRAKETVTLLRNGSHTRIEIDTEEIVEGEKPDIPLLEGDLVLVPERLF